MRLQPTPRQKLFLGCVVFAFLTSVLAWWLLAQLGHAQTLANAALGPGSRAALGLRAHYSHVLLIGWLGIGAIGIGAFTLGRWFSKELARPLDEAAALALRIAGGDLSSQLSLTGDDAQAVLMGALQELNDKLVATVAGLRGGVTELSGGCGALAAGHTRLVAQANRQMAALRSGAQALAQLGDDWQAAKAEPGAGPDAHDLQFQATLGKVKDAMATIERAAIEVRLVSEQSSAADLREHTRAMARMLAMFRSTRRPTYPDTHLHLVASNPGLCVKPQRDRRGRARICAVKP